MALYLSCDTRGWYLEDAGEILFGPHDNRDTLASMRDLIIEIRRYKDDMLSTIIELSSSGYDVTELCKELRRP